MFRKTVGFVLCTAWLLSLGGLGSSASAQPEHSLTLVHDGQPASALVLAVNATRAAQFAALELQEHVRLITGATLPIVTEPDEAAGVLIYVGESPGTRRMGLRNDSFGVQEYLVRFLPEALVLMGHDAEDYGEVDHSNWATFPDIFSRHATEYAVYDFLERYCDVRWFRPGNLGTEYPEMQTLTVRGGEVRRCPGFSHVNSYMGIPGDARIFDRRTRLWMNTDLQAQEAEALLYPELYAKYQGKGGEYMLKMRRLGLLFMHRHRTGGEPFKAGHAFYGYYQRFWKDPSATEPSPLFEVEHPDWFAQGYQGKPPQMCYTNPEFIAQVVKDARDYFDGNPPHYGAQAAGDFFGVGPMDNSSYCKCPRCQAWFDEERAADPLFSNGRWSDYLWNFANQVAREVRKTHPDKYITLSAYSKYALYPRRVKPEPNIGLQLALHVRNWWCPAIKQRDLEVVDQWTGDGSGRPAYVYGYWSFPAEIAHQSRNAWHCFPQFQAHEADWQIKYFKQRGIRGFFYTLAPGPDGYFNLKLMENPEADVEQVIDDYFTRYYGHAAEPMKELYLEMEQTVTTPSNYPDWVLESPSGMHQNAEIAWGVLGTAERMAEFGRLMDEAKAAAVTEKEKTRIEVFDKEIWSYMVAGRELYASQESIPRPTAQVPYLATESAGDSLKVDWSQATALAPWVTASGVATDHELQGRIAHDGKWLYLQLVDVVDPKLLTINRDTLAVGDDWEIFWAGQRAKPYYQLLIGPAGANVLLLHDALGTHEHETETYEGGGVHVHSDTSADDRWVTHVAIPLSTMLPGGVKRGDMVYMNIFRASRVKGTKSQYWSATFGGPHQLRRMGEITLE